jgi:hypothetical protein
MPIAEDPIQWAKNERGRLIDERQKPEILGGPIAFWFPGTFVLSTVPSACR